ncbi:MAG: phospholipase D-like domain-containing protein [Pseudomonadota bacterium]
MADPRPIKDAIERTETIGVDDPLRRAKDSTDWYKSISIADPIKRIETTHIDEVTRTARGVTQWFAENLNLHGRATHPITHNNRLTVFICGEESFADIAAQIAAAKESIDLCCWGFDPGMELMRSGSSWPRGVTYGDLLIAAAKRGVKVRLLVWYDPVGSGPARNMPGHSHDRHSWVTGPGGPNPEHMSAQNSIAMLREELAKPSIKRHPDLRGDDAQLVRLTPFLARREYCSSWYAAAFQGLLKGISVCKRSGSTKDIKASLARETHQPAGLSDAEFERLGMVHLGTHHQKPILIDYGYEGGRKAVGYVMGLNSVTDYWDSSAHLIDDPRRERCGAHDGQDGFSHVKPYQDYACRIEGGRALTALYENFTTGWDRAIGRRWPDVQCYYQGTSAQCHFIPPALLCKAVPGDSTVQIVRTQPEDQDKSIRDIYFQATDIATLAGGYLYVENQYFQYEEWAQRLMKKRKDVVAGWNRGRRSQNKGMEDMPFMHVFIVIPVPERAQMIPRTYNTLATLGSHTGMTGQVALIEAQNQRRPTVVHDEFGVRSELGAQLSPVVIHANSIDKPDLLTLEETFGLKVSVAMLNVCDLKLSSESGRSRITWRYREIYIHSKLLLVNDGFLTLGSANLNQRSMAVDSEINIATDNPALARDLRERIWMQHSGGTISGGGGTKTEIKEAFEEWTKLMKKNRDKKFSKSANALDKKMTGFLLPLEDPRSSTSLLG